MRNKGFNENSSFRLIKVTIFDHKYLNNISLDFLNHSNKNYNFEEPFSSLIIGPNGTGKSQLLRVIIDIFRDLAYQKYREKKKNITKYRYILEYELNGRKYTVRNDSNKKTFIVDGEHIGIHDLILPEKILASSFMLNDAFLFVDNEKNKPKKRFYEYLGIRGSSGTAGTRGYLKKTVECVINSSDDLTFINNLKSILKFLNLQPYFNIYFKTRFNKYFFNVEITESVFESFFKDWKRFRPNRKTEPYSINFYNKLSQEEIKELVAFINRSQNRIKPFSRHSKKRTAHILDYNIIMNDTNPSKKTIEDFNCIKKLMKLDILSYPRIKINKINRFGGINKRFDLEESSSGEYHFISAIIGILANIKPNSLILIDEPEISLHPNWQIKYVDFLKKVFSKYPSCHFIIATHSHFMVSDIKDSSSSMISLKRNPYGEIKPRTHDENTYGWTAEDILYNIFEVPTVRNFYLADKVGDILSLISKEEQNIDEIKKHVSELKNIHLELKDIDPLKQIIEKLVERFG